MNSRLASRPLPSKFLVLYSSNILVNGKARCAIYCLDKGQIYLVPKTFYKVIQQLKSTPLETLISLYSDQQDIIESYLEFIFREKLGFLADNVEEFPPMEIQFNTPEFLTGVVVDFAFKFEFSRLVESFNECNCKYLQLILRNRDTTIQQVETILAESYGSTLRNIEIILRFNGWSDYSNLRGLAERYKKLVSFVVCDYPSDDQIYRDGVKYIFSKANLNGYVSNSRLRDILIINRKFFSECHSFNPKFNKKAFIDVQGQIKNGISERTVFGNIRTDNLLSIVTDTHFQALWKKMPWNLSNSEFRYCVYNPSKQLRHGQFLNCKVVNRFTSSS